MTQMGSHGCNDLLFFPHFGSLGSHCTSTVIFPCVCPTIQVYPDVMHVQVAHSVVQKGKAEVLGIDRVCGLLGTFPIQIMGNAWIITVSFAPSVARMDMLLNAALSLQSPESTLRCYRTK